MEDPLTPKQREAVELVEKHGGIRAAARASNRKHSTIQGLLSDAAKHGVVPQLSMETRATMADRIAGRSTLRRYEYEKSGDVVLEWELARQSEKEDRLQGILDAATKAFKAGVKPRKKAPRPKRGRTDLLNCYILTDYHLGMLAWDREAGEDWDIDIARDLLLRWFETAIQASPDADHAVFAQIGDFLHWDGLEAITPENRNNLDADTRFQKLVEVASEVVLAIIEMMLAKYRKITVLMCDANHDPAGEVWLRTWLALYYRNNPAITVDVSADTYYCVEFGQTSLFFHHGHKRKPKSVDDVFVAKFRPVFGRTKQSYAHMGHQHHRDVEETNLMEVEQHRTLAAKDAYASRGGWMAKRAACVITYDKEHGEVGRLTLTPEMVS